MEKKQCEIVKETLHKKKGTWVQISSDNFSLYEFESVT